jgi:hypothetical protein
MKLRAMQLTTTTRVLVFPKRVIAKKIRLLSSSLKPANQRNTAKSRLISARGNKYLANLKDIAISNVLKRKPPSKKRGAQTVDWKALCLITRSLEQKHFCMLSA